MDRTSFEVARIATGNVRVSRDRFVRVWREADRRQAESARNEIDDWYTGAVLRTCRWIAAVPMRTAMCGGLTRSPVTQRAFLARPESIEAEWQAAQRPEQFSPDLAARPGWCEGVRATFSWAWCRQGPAPIELSTCGDRRRR